MSQQTLARRLGISKQYLSKAEAGTYSSLNPALLKWTANAMGWTTQSTAKRYEQFQTARRRETIEDLQPHALVSNGNEANHVTFGRWRNGYWPSVMAFATSLCVHPDLVAKYEDGIQKTMPKQIREVLLKFNLIDDNWR